jgi:hypothetical protein
VSTLNGKTELCEVSAEAARGAPSSRRIAFFDWGGGDVIDSVSAPWRGARRRIGDPFAS